MEQKENETEQRVTAKTLNCVEVPGGSMYGVKIESDKYVWELKEVIQKKNSPRIKCAASDSTLYIAKRNGVWLKWNDDAIQELKKDNDVPIKEIMTEEMPPVYPIDEPSFAFPDTPTKGDIHVVVQVPTQAFIKAYANDRKRPAEVEFRDILESFDPRIVGESEESLISNKRHRMDMAGEENPDQQVQNGILDQSICNECANVANWPTDQVHDLSSTYKFMTEFGGCTGVGKIFWRKEEKQVASILIDCWFQKSDKDYIRTRADKQCILMGSPGIGKSTLLCLLAFHLVVKHKKTVLIYRKLPNRQKKSSLLCLASCGDRVAYYGIPQCRQSTAESFYNNLCSKMGFENVWLFMDGFRYDSIGEPFNAYHLLATSQQVDLKSQEREGAYCCLLPCWSIADLRKMGNKIYKYTDEAIDERFYYSGGSVREFTMKNIVDIQDSIEGALKCITSLETLLSSQSIVSTGSHQVDRIRHTFVNGIDSPHHFLYQNFWLQVVDSRFALAGISASLNSGALYRTYEFAVGTGLPHLARQAFEAYVHHRMSERDVSFSLHVSEYDGRSDGHINWQLLSLKDGSVLHQGSSKEEDYKEYLARWRMDDRYRYWHPNCHDFPNIDSIVKLESTSDKKGNVAYLQITVAQSHKIDEKHLKTLNQIFYPSEDAGDTEAPIYIAILPNRQSCESFTLDPAVGVLESRKLCKLFVGYFDTCAADGPYNNKILPMLPASAPYNLRSSDISQSN